MRIESKHIVVGSVVVAAFALAVIQQPIVDTSTAGALLFEGGPQVNSNRTFESFFTVSSASKGFRVEWSDLVPDGRKRIGMGVRVFKADEKLLFGRLFYRTSRVCKGIQTDRIIAKQFESGFFDCLQGPGRYRLNVYTQNKWDLKITEIPR